MRRSPVRTGRTNTFTFFRVSPALIWDAERPESFKGTAVPKLDETETTSETPAAEAANSNHVAPAPGAESAEFTKQADSLDAVLKLLGTDILNPAAETPAEKPCPQTKPSRPAKKKPEHKPTNSSAITVGNDGTEPSGEHFVVWLRDAILSKS